MGELGSQRHAPYEGGYLRKLIEQIGSEGW
jgi:hypothetical protein